MGEDLPPQEPSSYVQDKELAHEAAHASNELRTEAAQHAQQAQVVDDLIRHGEMDYTSSDMADSHREAAAERNAEAARAEDEVISKSSEDQSAPTQIEHNGQIYKLDHPATYVEDKELANTMAHATSQEHDQITHAQKVIRNSDEAWDYDAHSKNLRKSLLDSINEEKQQLQNAFEFIENNPEIAERMYLEAKAKVLDDWASAFRKLESYYQENKEYTKYSIDALLRLLTSETGVTSEPTGQIDRMFSQMIQEAAKAEQDKR